jgi:hypothetical protein
MQEDTFPHVSISFRFPPSETSTSNVNTTIVTKNVAAVDLNSVSSVTYEYSGRHDHGQLETLKTGGDLAILIGSIQEAKRECDSYLTDCINVEYGYAPSSKEGDGCGDDGNISDSDEKMTGNQKKKLKKGK